MRPGPRNRCGRCLPPGFALLLVCLAPGLVLAEDLGGDETENASNPLAKTRNTDVSGQGFEFDSEVKRRAAVVEGAFMARDDLKVKYEVHYWRTTSTGEVTSGFERLSLKGIWFPAEGRRGNLGYRWALGLEWILDGGNSDIGIGSGGDQLAPFAGIALVPRSGTTIIPLVQHFESYRGDPVSMTAGRVIAMQNLGARSWLKLDAIVPVDWENDATVPATAEVQYGLHLNRAAAVFVDGLVGLGKDRPYEWGLGLGVRFSY